MSFVDMQNMGKEIWRRLTTRLLPEPPKDPPSKSQMKRLKEKLKKNQLQKSGCSFLYLFAYLHNLSPPKGYVMYKINYNHLNNTIEQLLSDDKYKAESKPLIPLLVFQHRDLPIDFCSLVSLGDYLYFVGNETAVFTILKSDIQNLTPNETNRGSLFLKLLDQPMNSTKYNPLVFVAKGNLYVISVFHHGSQSHQFEMYSPSSKTWTVLNYRPNGPYGPFKSHVVVDDTVYFATKALDRGDYDESVFSYNLTNKSWKLLSTSPVDGFSYDLHPAFEPPVFLIGDMLFGGFSLPSPLFLNTVAASPYANINYSDPDAQFFFMRPTLAPQQNFCLEFDRRHHYVIPNFSASYYMTDMQTSKGENVLSCVSYGYHPTSGDTVVFFNFFKISRDPPVSLEDEPLDVLDSCYYAKQVDSGSALRSYFKSEFMHRKLFKISTNELLVNPGRLITCFSY